jgi:myxalamid-type polyketide synthase MxaB
VRQLRQTPAVEARLQLAAHAHRQVAEVLGLNPANPLDPRQSLFELGMDSLTALEIKNRFQTSLGCQVPAGLLLDRPSLDGLVDYLAINLQEQAS